MKIKIYAVFLAFLLLIGTFSMGATSALAEEIPPTSEETQLDTTGLIEVVRNTSSALYVEVETANFFFHDIKSGAFWSAFPKDADSTFSSIIKVSYISDDGVGAVVTAPSRESGYEIKKIENGIKIIFSFSSENTNFSVPLTAVIGEGYLDVSVLYEDIEENGGSRITDIEVLSNFMHGTRTDSGYAFIPDGSGAIINYSDSQSRNESYTARVYGNDPCQDLIYPIISDSKNALLPVYGAVKGDSALFAVITDCDVYASVNATMMSDSLIVNSSFIFRECDVTGLQQSGGAKRTLDIIQSEPVNVAPQIRFYILSGENANYSGMANCYRDYLLSQKVISEKEKSATPAVSVMAFGAAPEKKVVFGIPLTTVRKATDFSELTSLYDSLTEDGGEAPSFYLYGFLSGGYGAKTVTKPDYIGKLGGKKGYNSFVQKAGSDNVFTVYNTERSYGRPFDFLRFKDYMSSLNQTSVKVYYRSLASGRWHSKFGFWSFYTIKYQQKLVTKLIKQQSSGSSIVFEHYGEQLLSDFTSDSPTGRQSYLNFVKQAMQKASSKGLNIALEGGNGCVVGSANELYDIPLTSSGFAIESKNVPFYTMVFHSYKKLSSTPVNFESDSDEFALRAFETGVSATYAVSGCDSHELKDTVFNFLYNSKIADNLSDMKKYIKDYSEIHKELADKTIVRHEYVGNLSITEYEGGTKIVCNYGETEETYNNTKIASLEYTVIG